jgi:hypothetical protein
LQPVWVRWACSAGARSEKLLLHSQPNQHTRLNFGEAAARRSFLFGAEKREPAGSSLVRYFDPAPPLNGGDHVIQICRDDYAARWRASRTSRA